jgi:4-amino-4-deoxy-L-arabinose transferase-like glycosyltransferase
MTQPLGGREVRDLLPTEPSPSDSKPSTVPLFVWLTVGLQASLILLAMFIYPAGYGYDEPQHVDMAYSYAQGNGVLAPGERYLGAGVARIQVGPGFPPSQPFADTPVAPRTERLSFNAQGGDLSATGGLPNQMVQHPPLYYLAGAGVLLLPGVDTLAYDQQIFLLRLLSAFMISLLPLIAWATARRVLGDGPLALAAAVVPVTLPNLTRTGASFNNDSLIIFLTSLFTLLLASVIRGDRSPRTAWLLGLTMLGAMLTKAFGLVLPLVVVAGYFAGWLRIRGPLPFIPAATALLVGSVPGSLWWIHNVFAYGALQPFGYGVPPSTILGPPRPPTGDAFDFLSGFFTRLSARFYGGIGLPESPTFAPILAHALLLVLVGLLATALAGTATRGRVGSSPPRMPRVVSVGRIGLLALLLPGLLTLIALVFEVYRKWSTYGGAFPAVQGRYLYLAVVALAAVAMAGIGRLVGGRPSCWVPLMVALAAVAIQAYAWRLLLTAWWVPVDAHEGGALAATAAAWGAIATWSPWPPWFTVLPTVLTLVASAACLVAAIMIGLNPSWSPRFALRDRDVPRRRHR